MTSWVVVVELAVGPGAPYLDLDEIDRVVQAAEADGLKVVYDPDRHALQVVVDAATAAEALHTALGAWREAARDSGASAWSVVRTEVSARDGSPGAS